MQIATSAAPAPGFQRRCVPAPSGRSIPGYTCPGSPRRAWWRGLFSWAAGPEGDTTSDSDELQALRLSGGSDEEAGTGVDIQDIQVSSPSSAASPSRQPPAAAATAAAVAPLRPSDHLKWARQVSKVQGEWLREQRSLNQRSTVARCGRRRRCETCRPHRDDWCPPNTGAGRQDIVQTPGNVISMVPPARAWVQALRGEQEGLEPPPSNWQEQKHIRLRRERALQRLNLTQTMWRQDQARKGQLAKCETAMDYTEAIELAPSGEEWDWPAGDAVPLLPVWESAELGETERTEVGATRSSVQRKVASSGASEDGVDHELRSKRSVSSLSSGSEGDHSARGAVRRYAASRKTEAQSKFSRSSSALSDGGSMVENREESISTPTGIPKATSAVSSTASLGETPDCTEEAGEAYTKRIQEDEIAFGSCDDASGQPPASPSDISGLGKPEKDTAAFERTLTSEAWEEWRADFPLDLLDAAADFYDSIPREDDGTRVIPVLQLQEISMKVFGFPPQVVLTELASSSLPRAPRHRPSLMVPSNPGSSVDTRGVILSSLPEFLNFLRGTLQRLEREHIELIWSQEDLRHVEGIFMRHANSSNCIPMAILFEVIQELSFEDLRVGELEQQRWIADVTRCTLACRRANSNAADVGTLSLKDFIRIVTRALREKEKSKRLEDFMREWQARKLAGFSPVEMEDLRELHRTYAKLEVPVRRNEAGSKDPLVRLTMLLHSCGLGNLSERDASALQRIVRKLTAPADMQRLLGDTAPFDIFMLWMREIFTQSIGNLQWKGAVSSLPGTPSPGAKNLPTEEELAGRKGFTAGMLREALCSSTQTSSENGNADGAPAGELATQTVSELNTLSDASSRRGGTENVTRRSRLAGEAKGRHNSSEMRNRDSALMTDHVNVHRGSGDASFPRGRRLSGESQALSTPDRKSRSSQINSRTSSQTNSRRNSHDATASNSGPPPGSGAAGTLGSAGKGSLPTVQGGANFQEELGKHASRGKAITGTMLVLKGLPPSEAMLSRKEFRACSVDLSNINNAQSQGDGIDNLDKTGISNGGKSEKLPSRRSQLAVLPQLPVSTEVTKASPAQAKRKMKPVQDSLDIVNNAIAKLAEEQAYDPPLSPGGNSPKNNFEKELEE